MEEIVLSLFEDGVLQRNGAVKLARSMNAVKVPATVQAILAARIDRLPPDEKELLQTLALLGREFTLSLVRLVAEGPKDDELERKLATLQMAEFIYEQPATGDVEYIFKHALTQEVAYGALLVERRKLLHERAGGALESMFAGHLEDHLDELAHHYGRSDNAAKAVEYLGLAGQRALHRSAYADAISTLSAAINLVQKLAQSPERVQQELLLQLAIGPALMAVKGWAALDVERAYTRTRELCEQLGDSTELFPALYGLCTVRLLRGEVRKAYELAEQLLLLAQTVNDPTLLPHAQHSVGSNSYWMGEFLSAREHLESAIMLYDPKPDQPLIVRYVGVDREVRSLSYVAITLWQLGYPDQALKRSNEALALAQRLSHPFSLVFAQNIAGGVLRQLRREPCHALETAESTIAISAAHGLADPLAYATVMAGWAMAEQGTAKKGLHGCRKAWLHTARQGRN
jgi:predicted ATPase